MNSPIAPLIIIGFVLAFFGLIYFATKINLPAVCKPHSKGKYLYNSFIQALCIGGVVFAGRVAFGCELSFAFWPLASFPVMAAHLLSFAWCVLSFFITIVGIDFAKGLRSPFTSRTGMFG